MKVGDKVCFDNPSRLDDFAEIVGETDRSWIIATASGKTLYVVKGALLHLQTDLEKKRLDNLNRNSSIISEMREMLDNIQTAPHEKLERLHALMEQIVNE